MTISLNHIPSPNNSTAHPLRCHQENEPIKEKFLCVATTKKPLQASSPCSSPPRIYLSRGHDNVDLCSSDNVHSRPLKTPRSISPGGTPSSSPSFQGNIRLARVHWASNLVSVITTRPKTLKEDIPLLFYSRADERRFRREAERESLDISEEASDNSFSSVLTPTPPLFASMPPPSEKKKYSISQAVVVFGATTKTFGGIPSIWEPLPTAVSGGCALEASSYETLTSSASMSFDDPAFWNGILTWS